MEPDSNPDVQEDDELDIDDLIDANYSRDRSHPIRHTKDMTAAKTNMLAAQILSSPASGISLIFENIP